MEAFQLEAAGMDNSVIVWSQGVPWQTPASDDALPEELARALAEIGLR